MVLFEGQPMGDRGGRLQYYGIIISAFARNFLIRYRDDLHEDKNGHEYRNKPSISQYANFL